MAQQSLRPGRAGRAGGMARLAAQCSRGGRCSADTARTTPAPTVCDLDGRRDLRGGLVPRSCVVAPRPSAVPRVVVRSPSRLHLGLLNEGGVLGRIDGGIGVSLREPCWEIEVARAPHQIRGRAVATEQRAAVSTLLDRLSSLIPRADVAIRIRRAIPSHAGFGSKTSLLLAIGKAVSMLAGAELSYHEIASLARRGGTSGIGVHSVAGGRFIWDAGRRFPEAKAEFAPSSLSSADPPRAIMTLAIDWLKVVHFRFPSRGISGQAEVDAFRAACPIRADETKESILLVATQIAPGLLEQDDDLVHAGLRRLQEIGMKSVEWYHQSRVTQAFRAYWDRLAVPEAVGLSSFGPTLYVLTRRPQHIVGLIRGYEHAPLHIAVTSVDNAGLTAQEIH